MAKANMVREYLEEEVNYGGIRMPRGEMIRELTVTAKATGREDWQALVNAYLAGHAQKNADRPTNVAKEKKEMRRKAHQIEHSIDFSPKQWEEICSLSFEPFDIGEGEGMTRRQWLAVAQMALGKSMMLAEGRYDMGDEDDTDNEQWAGELQVIADTILAKFQPGDGNL